MQTSYRKADSTAMECWIRRAGPESTGMRQGELQQQMQVSPGMWWLLWLMMLEGLSRGVYRAWTFGTMKSLEKGTPSAPVWSSLSPHRPAPASCQTTTWCPHKHVLTAHITTVMVCVGCRRHWVLRALSQPVASLC